MPARVTQRDIGMLETLARARFLPAPALEWLFFEGWQRRWAEYLAALEQKKTTYYKPSSRLYTRLGKLRRAGLVLMVSRPVSLAVSTFARDTSLYALTREGASIVSAYASDITPDELEYEVPRERSFISLAHSAAIGSFYAALKAKIETMVGVELEGWRNDHQLSRTYDRIPVRLPMATGGTKVESLPVLPDATFVIRSASGAGVRFFLEVDRGRPVESWRKKVRAYEAYANSPALRNRYETDRFVVLTATTTERQRQHLMEGTAQVIGSASDRYLYTLIDDIHPLSIGTWWKAARVEPVTKQAGLGRQRTTYKVEEAPHTLLK